MVPQIHTYVKSSKNNNHDIVWNRWRLLSPPFNSFWLATVEPNVWLHTSPLGKPHCNHVHPNVRTESGGYFCTCFSSLYTFPFNNFDFSFICFYPHLKMYFVSENINAGYETLTNSYHMKCVSSVLGTRWIIAVFRTSMTIVMVKRLCRALLSGQLRVKSLIATQ